MPAPNLYCSLPDLKTRIGEATTTYDAPLLLLLEAVSRAVDAYTNRFFYVVTETRYYDGAGRRLLLDQDLISVATLKTDDNDDGVYEATWASTDYDLLPYNAPHKVLVAVRRAGTKHDFNPGLTKTVEVVGTWGYADAVDASGATINEGGTYSASDTTLTVSSGAAFKTGQTLRIESEQLYVSAISGNNLTVTRGVNGTTAATHADGTAISILAHPRAVAEATLQQAALIWARRAAGFIAPTSPLLSGPLPDLDPHIRGLLLPFRRVTFARV